MTKHYKYGGSTATRTLNCPGWRSLADKMPRGPVSDAAKEGTSMHWLFEQGIINPDFDPGGHLNEVVEGVLITDEMVEKVISALEHSDDFQYEHSLALDAEQTLEFNELIGGTADLTGYNVDRNVFATGDLKTGDGIMVYAEDNDQLLFYAWLAYLEHKDTFPFDDNTRILTYIIQPSERRDEVLDVWETNVETLELFAKRFLDAVRVAESDDPLFSAGRWCKFCPSEGVCPIKTGMVSSALRLKANSKELETLNQAMSMVDMVEQWVKAVRKLAHEQAEQGVKIEGYKLVPKRASRVWNDPEGIAKKFKHARGIYVEDYYDMKLLSPAKMEKVCKAKGLDFTRYVEYISLHSSGNTLVKDSDKRSAVLPLTALAQLSASIKN